MDDTDAEEEKEDSNPEPSTSQEAPVEDEPTQHKTMEGPLEGSANLTFSVPILKVSS